MPDEEIDKLFRQAASQFEPEFNPAYWEKMQAKLNTASANDFVHRRLAWVLLTEGFLLILACLLLFVHSENKSPQPAVAQKYLTEQNQNLEQKLQNIIKEKETNNTQTPENQINSKTDEEKNKNLISEKVRGIQKPESQKREIVIRKTEQKFPEEVTKKKLQIPDENLVSKEKVGEKKNLPFKKIPPAILNSGNSAGKDSVKKPENLPQISADRKKDDRGSSEHLAGKTVQPIALLTPKFNLLQPDSLTETVLPISVSLKDTSAVMSARKPKEKQKLINHFGVGFVIAPDLSGIGLPNLKNPGKSLGLTLEYNFARRWTLSTGAIFARKIYSARPEDYHTEWEWFKRVTVTDIKINCLVVDIPVNIRYNLLMQSKHNFYLSTGISSYFMKQEDYNYHYTLENEPNVSKMREWNFSNQNRHLFGVANFSLGYEKVFSQRFSIQAEPFFKLPLTDIGMARVRLNSAGVFFMARYRFR